MRKFFLDRVSEESVLSGQSFMYLHYADMIANGYHRTMPCPFQSQGLLLNPEGNLFYCENSEKLGNVLDESAESLYFKVANLAHREELKDKDLSDVPEPLPGERRRHEAGRALREVPAPGVPREARSGATSRNHSAGPVNSGTPFPVHHHAGPRSCGWRLRPRSSVTSLRAPIPDRYCQAFTRISAGPLLVVARPGAGRSRADGVSMVRPPPSARARADAIVRRRCSDIFFVSTFRRDVSARQRRR